MALCCFVQATCISSASLLVMVRARFYSFQATCISSASLLVMVRARFYSYVYYFINNNCIRNDSI